MLTFRFLIFVIFGCYCVVYVTVLLFSVFCIFKGNAATAIRYGGKYNNYLVTNLLLRPAVKEF